MTTTPNVGGPVQVPTFYDALVAAGVPTDNHESDLYFLDTPESAAIAKSYGVRAARFRSNVDGKVWRDAPLLFSPFWERVARRAK